MITGFIDEVEQDLALARKAYATPGKQVPG